MFDVAKWALPSPDLDFNFDRVNKIIHFLGDFAIKEQGDRFYRFEIVLTSDQTTRNLLVTKYYRSEVVNEYKRGQCNSCLRVPSAGDPQIDATNLLWFYFSSEFDECQELTPDIRAIGDVINKDQLLVAFHSSRVCFSPPSVWEWVDD